MPKNVLGGLLKELKDEVGILYFTVSAGAGLSAGTLTFIFVLLNLVNNKEEK